jgi:hypothetical protein
MAHVGGQVSADPPPAPPEWAHTSEKQGARPQHRVCIVHLVGKVKDLNIGSELLTHKVQF